MDEPEVRVRTLLCIDGPLAGNRYTTSAQRLEVYTADGYAVYDLDHSHPMTDPDWFQKGWDHPWGFGAQPSPVYWLKFVRLQPLDKVR